MTGGKRAAAYGVPNPAPKRSTHDVDWPPIDSAPRVDIPYVTDKAPTAPPAASAAPKPKATPPATSVAPNVASKPKLKPTLAAKATSTAPPASATQLPPQKTRVPAAPREEGVRKEAPLLATKQAAGNEAKAKQIDGRLAAAAIAPPAPRLKGVTEEAHGARPSSAVAKAVVVDGGSLASRMLKGVRGKVPPMVAEEGECDDCSSADGLDSSDSQNDCSDDSIESEEHNTEDESCSMMEADDGASSVSSSHASIRDNRRERGFKDEVIGRIRARVRDIEKCRAGRAACYKHFDKLKSTVESDMFGRTMDSVESACVGLLDAFYEECSRSERQQAQHTNTLDVADDLERAWSKIDEIAVKLKKARSALDGALAVAAGEKNALESRTKDCIAKVQGAHASVE